MLPRLTRRSVITITAAVLFPVIGCQVDEDVTRNATSDSADDAGETPQATSGSEGSDEWEAAPVDLPPGTRYATYDASSDAIWLLTWVTPARPKVLLTRFDIQSGTSETFEISGPYAERLGVGAGILTDDAGAVWLAYGRRLQRYDPDTESQEGWDIPDPGPQYLARVDSGLDRFAVDVALDANGLFWVALHSITGLYAFDPADSSWDFYDTSPHIALDNTKVTAANGLIYFNGFNPIDQSFGLLRLDPATRDVTPIGEGAISYVLNADGSVTYLETHNDIEGNVTVRRTGQAEALAEFSGVPAPYAYMALDDEGNAWFRRTGRLAVDIVRIDPSGGELATFAYPLVISVWDGSEHFPRPLGSEPRGSPEPVAADPGIQALVVDKRGDIWVVSASGGNPPIQEGAYPPLYRLHPE